MFMKVMGKAVPGCFHCTNSSSYTRTGGEITGVSAVRCSAKLQRALGFHPAVWVHVSGCFCLPAWYPEEAPSLLVHQPGHNWPVCLIMSLKLI